MSGFDLFVDIFEEARRIVVLTGAGVSTLSGIPDFRSSNGLYSKKFGHMSVEEILDIRFFTLHPDVFYSWAKGNWYILESFKPNIIHYTLAKLETIGKLSEGIFTQNIDGLHQKAGSKKVYELHGSLRNGYCTNCHAWYSYEEISRWVNKDMVPVCSQCGGVIKPDIVFYGEPLDSTMLERADNAFSKSDLALVFGSSLVVNPAASLPSLTVNNGANVVIVNRDKTYLDDYAKLRFDDLKSFFDMFSSYLDTRK